MKYLVIGLVFIIDFKEKDKFNFFFEKIMVDFVLLYICGVFLSIMISSRMMC